jgi:multiple sugar transport system permease protein
MFDLSSRSAKIVFGLSLLLIGFYLFFPIYWMVTSSFKANGELYQVIPTWYPHEFTFAHYWSAIAESKLLVYLGNSLITSGSSALINTVLAVYAGYSFAKYRYFGRQPIMLFMLSAQMFPFGLLLISIYPLMTNLGLLDTRPGLILSYIVFALPVATYMLYS